MAHKFRWKLLNSWCHDLKTQKTAVFVRLIVTFSVPVKVKAGGSLHSPALFTGASQHLVEF